MCPSCEISMYYINNNKKYAYFILVCNYNLRLESIRYRNCRPFGSYNKIFIEMCGIGTICAKLNQT